MNDERFYVLDSDGNELGEPYYNSLTQAVEAASAVCLFVWGAPDTAEGVTETEIARVVAWVPVGMDMPVAATVQAVLAPQRGHGWKSATVTNLSGQAQGAYIPRITYSTFGLDILAEGRDGTEDMPATPLYLDAYPDARWPVISIAKQRWNGWVVPTVTQATRNDIAAFLTSQEDDDTAASILAVAANPNGTYTLDLGLTFDTTESK